MPITYDEAGVTYDDLLYTYDGADVDSNGRILISMTVRVSDTIGVIRSHL